MTQTSENISRALQEWRELLGDRGIWEAGPATAAYGSNTIGIERTILAVLKPDTVEEISRIVWISGKYGVPLYPISSGRNWGYGSANPVGDETVVLDLSDMNRILEMDRELGMVTVEPGVTQKQLREYLDEHKYPFLVPVHGGGPDCSLVGNAVERGYGITPHADHFGAVTYLEAVLPNGDIYRSALSDMGGATIDRAFKWGIGPYLDGLFTQGNFGIVTRMTIALAPIPEKIYNYFFWIDRDEKLEQAVETIRDVLRTAGMNCGSINLMNPLRVLSMMEPFPSDKTPADQVIPQPVIEEMARRNMVAAWMGTGAIYGSATLARATRAIIKKKLGPLCKRLVFLTPQSVGYLKMATRCIPGEMGRRFNRLARTLDATVRLIAGSPSTIALPLCYWRSGTKPDNVELANPANDGCGLIWYSPLVPMKPERVRVYNEMVKRVCTEYGIDPLITLTSLSERCFDSTVPLLFVRGDREAARRAQACYDALFEAGKKEGFIPYRVGVQSMRLITSEASSYWRLATQLKRVIDPKNIIAPGRYSFSRFPEEEEKNP